MPTPEYSLNSLRSMPNMLKSSPSTESVSPIAPPKRQRRKKNNDSESYPAPKKQKGSASSSRSSIIGVTRSISACQRCRLRKTRCDQKFPSCTSCLKANTECVGIDAATGREIPRSYVSHLEDRVAQLELQLQKHGVDYDNLSLDTLNAPSIHVTADFESDSKNLNFSPKISSNLSKKSYSEVDKLMTSVKKVSVESGTIPPSSYLGSSSGLSFARLLFTAVKFKSQDNSANPTPVPESSESLKGKSVSPAALPPKDVAENLLSIYFSLANPQLPVIHREQFLVKYFRPIYGTFSSGVSLASDYTTIGVSVGGPSTPSEEGTYYAKHYGHTSASSKAAPSHKNLPDRPYIAIEDLCHPIPESINPNETSPALFFLNIVFGIATSSLHQNFPAHIPEAFRVAAMKHVDSVFSSPNRLEALQGILLLALYSIMRPAVPGVWYVLGSAMRLCVDLGLHTEEGIKSWYKAPANTNQNPNFLGSDQESHNHHSYLNLPEYDAATLDLRRRLFWCTYALDRQVCVYLGRPVGFPEHSIKVPFPSELDDALIVDFSFGTPPESVMDYSLEKSTSPSYKIVSLSFFKIRKIQAEIQKILYDCAPIGRQFSGLDEWRDAMAEKLEHWHNSCPKSKKRMNCDFNVRFMELNYQQTRLLLFGLCPAYTSPPTLDSYKIIAEAGEQVIRNYQDLHSKGKINYTWVAVHNLFMAGTSYFYALYHSPEVRAATTIAEIDYNTRECNKVLTSLVTRCDAAVSCRDTFQLLTAAILKLCYNEQAGVVMQLPNDRYVNHVSKEQELVNLPPSRVSASDYPYIQPHPVNYDGSMPRAEGQIEVESGLNGPANQHSRISTEGGPENMAMFDGSQHAWPEDLDLFFREAAQTDGISPNSDMSTIGFPPQQHPPYIDNSMNDSSRPQGSSNYERGNHIPVAEKYDMPYFSSDPQRAMYNPRGHRSDGQKIYDIISEVPNAAIWDQFFAPLVANGHGNPDITPNRMSVQGNNMASQVYVGSNTINEQPTSLDSKSSNLMGNSATSRAN